MTPRVQAGSFDNRLLFWHLTILSLGFLAGMTAAYLFTCISFDFSGELELARQLGIVSPTILSGYAKKRDILNYLATTGFPVLFGVGAWLIWARGGQRKEALAVMFASDPVPAVKTRDWRILLLLTACAYLVFSFNLNLFHYPAYNEYAGAWPFLGEEGENLAWVHSLLNGGVYGKDIHCLYGPMLIYPLALFMKLLGSTVVTARVYTYLMDLLAYAIVLVFLYKTLRSRAVFICAAACYFLVFTQGPNHLLSPNITYLRVALGFVPILLVYLYLERKARWLVVAAGLVLGQSLLFSQEVGVCATLAVLALLAAAPRSERKVAGFGCDSALLLAGVAVSLVPMLGYFSSQGALGAFLTNLSVHPRLLGLGFTALAFPDLREFLHQPWPAFFHYWVIFVYIASTLYLVPMLILGRRDKETLLRLTLLAFGAILFRAALARSDVYHVFFVSQPAFLLVFLLSDGALAGAGQRVPRALVAARVTALAAMVAGMVLLCATSPHAGIWVNAKSHFKNFGNKLTVLPYGAAVPEVSRAGILFDSQTADSISKIDSFLNRYTRPSDYVYFFPNEAAYNFIFDRRNPTRYVISYFAVTRQQRLELIAELEEKRPEYVIYSLRTWRVDDIPETVQVPEVCDYLNRMYAPAENLGDVVVLKRKAL